MDYVSEEAGIAGANAAHYILSGKAADTHDVCDHSDASVSECGQPSVEIIPTGGVRYTVPKYIRPDAMADKVTVRFRVGQIYKNCGIATYFGKERISFRKRPVMAPGEMESVVLTKEQLTNCPDLEQITICIEEA